MPHITIEYTAGLSDFDAASALSKVNQALARSGQFEDADIKSRALALRDVLVGTAEGTSQGFVHATLRLLSGRSEQVRASVSAAVLEALVGSLPAQAGGQREVQVSVDVVEMDRATYAKRVVRT